MIFVKKHGGFFQISQNVGFFFRCHRNYSIQPGIVVEIADGMWISSGFILEASASL